MFRWAYFRIRGGKFFLFSDYRFKPGKLVVGLNSSIHFSSSLYLSLSNLTSPFLIGLLHAIQSQNSIVFVAIAASLVQVKLFVLQFQVQFRFARSSNMAINLRRLSTVTNQSTNFLASLLSSKEEDCNCNH